MKTHQRVPSDDEIERLGVIGFRVAFRLLGDRHEAEDITQDTLVKAVLRWQRISPYADAWVARVATNSCIGFARKRSRRSGQLGESYVDAFAEERLVLIRALRDLPRRQREAVTLRYLADLSVAETARVLGCAEGSVKTHTSRGLAALRSNDQLSDIGANR